MKHVLDWEKYLEASTRAVAEGIVLLKNEKKALPLSKDREIALFGRIQSNYYKSGTGSGGKVNVSEVITIPEGLRRRGATINQQLADTYAAWEAEHPFVLGEGWGGEPWAQEEMPLDEALVETIAKTSDTAVVIIGRTAGEEHDYGLTEGSYLLAKAEEEMLQVVRKHFEKVVVLLNVAAIIDMSFVEKYAPDAVAYVWQGGMIGGLGTADVLLGNVSPSGKLTDTIAGAVSDYPSHANFGDPKVGIYAEDIYLGYRYFETFAKDAVLYPFGFGLSYTNFEINSKAFEVTDELEDGCDQTLLATVTVEVTNTGDCAGKEVVQVYVEAPQGKLGKPARSLCAFAKTKELAPGETQEISLPIYTRDVASYDDSGVTGHPYSYLLEAGDYIFHVGNSCRDTILAGDVTMEEDLVLLQVESALAPVRPFQRMTNVNGTCQMQDVPLMSYDEEARRLERRPAAIPYTGDLGYKLADVVNGNCTLEAFVGQLSEEDLGCMIRGEGMGSLKVTAGTASAFGGVSRSLEAFGVPCGCCDDGPSGMRLDCGTKAFSLPNGTLLACTFNEEINQELFSFTGLEMVANKVECLLGPGMNLHRHPLNGRNFEYFSEDPYVTGKIATAQVKGLHTAGVTGTIKHFCANNQETGRHTIDSVVSERALRELYLRGFEIAVKEAKAPTVMTTYGSVNGLWTAGSYDLVTTILRGEWGFTGFVMTDWWPDINRRGQEPNRTDFAAMVKAQNDIYMVCALSEENHDNALDSLKSGDLTLGELQRSACNILRMLMDTQAMKRLMKQADEVEIINRPAEEIAGVGEDVEVFVLKDKLTVDLREVKTTRDTNHAFVLDVEEAGFYRFTLSGSSMASELAQIPVTVFLLGTACGTFTWNGTNGQVVSFTREVPVFSRRVAVRLYFAESGMNLEEITFEKLDYVPEHLK